MELPATTLANLSRIGVGLTFLLSGTLDIVARHEIFDLMRKKRVKLPSICFVGAISWKFITSIGLIINIYPAWNALLLALYIFLANLVFNNFWAAPIKARNFSIAMFLIHIGMCFGLLAIAASC